MRALTVAVIAVTLAAVTVLPATAATEEQLRQAALTSTDLGRGWSALQEGPEERLTAAGVTNYTAIYQRGPSLPNFRLDLVLISLVDEFALGALEVDIDDALGAIRAFGFELREETAPAIGTDTRRFALSGSVVGFPITGEIIVWRQAGILATVGALGTAGGAAEELARQQETRINAVIGY